MSQRRRLRNVVSCGKCGANYEARGGDPRCPACDARLADYEPGEVRPAVRGYAVGDLEGPDLLRDRGEEPVETAPLEDFLAAGLVLVAFIIMVAGVMMRSPAVLQAGMILFAVTGVGFGLVKLRKTVTGRSKRRQGSFDETPSMMDWLIGRGFWDRWR
jgi:hypothetical protein